MSQLPVDPEVVHTSPSLENLEKRVKTKNYNGPHTHRACDDCRIRKIRCKPLEDSCESCSKRNVPCTFVNPVMKRGPKPRDRDPSSLHQSSTFDHVYNRNNGDYPKKPIYGSRIHFNNNADRYNIGVKDDIEQLHIAPQDVNNISNSGTTTFSVKTDEYGSLNIMIDTSGRKMAHFYLCVRDEAHPPRYTPVSSTSLANHPFESIEPNTCQTHQVLGLLTSQQIYITIIFFTHVFPQYPSLNIENFMYQLTQPMTTSMLFLLNCICAVACPFGSNSKARFDKTQFYHKALEINYHDEEVQEHPNWEYGHILLKTLKPKSSLV